MFINKCTYILKREEEKKVITEEVKKKSTIEGWD